MRIFLWILATITSLSLEAQELAPNNSLNYGIWPPFPSYHSFGNQSSQNQPWYFSRYTGVTAGFGFYHGVSESFLSVPVGLQLNHPLITNLIAFAGISAAPSLIYFNPSLTHPGPYHSFPGAPFSNQYGFGMNTRIDMGLMYTNDAKTFSISGSIGIESSSYPVYPPSNQKRNSK